MFRAGALKKRVYIEPILHWSVKRVKKSEGQNEKEREIVDIPFLEIRRDS